MADNKGKTKAAMLQELESIKGLLHDQDDIPILQEMINEPDNLQPPLARHDLDELHSQFRELSQAIADSNKTTHQPAPSASTAPITREETADISASLLEAFTRASKVQPATTKPDAPLQQTSLFHEPPELQQQETGPAEPVVDNEPSATSNDERSVPDEAQRFNTDIPVQRASLAKASGENPFLPQHIRARLHGNNPPPLFDFSISKNLSLSNTNTATEIKSESKSENSMRQLLIQKVIASVLPQLEQELRIRLEEMSEQELEQMRR